MKAKLLLFFSLLLGFGAYAQCGGTPPPPGYTSVYGLDTDNDGFAVFDIQYYIDHIDRPLMESYFGASSSGYNATLYVNSVAQPFLFTNTSQNQTGGIDYQYTGTGPEFEPQPPCYWPVEWYFGSRGLLFIIVRFDSDEDDDGILNKDEDTNNNQNLMDDDDDHDGTINLWDTTNNLAISQNQNITLNIYPNPVTDGLLTFESNAAIERVIVFDLAGKQLAEYKPNSNTIRLDTITAGMYFAKFQSGNGSVTKKIAIR